MILGIREELVGQREEGWREVEGLITGRVKYGRDNLRVVRIYINKDMEKRLEGGFEGMNGGEGKKS